MLFGFKVLPAVMAAAFLLLGASEAFADRKDGEKQRRERWEDRDRDRDYRYGREGWGNVSGWPNGTASDKEWRKEQKEFEKDRRKAWKEREKDRREAAREWEKDRRAAAREARKNGRSRYYR